MEIAMVKLEAGKYYRTREREKAGPMRRYDGDSWSDGRIARLWNDDGSRYYGDMDGVIISEWTEAPKFKVGDRVRFTDATPEDWWVERGDVGTVSSIRADGGRYDVDVAVTASGFHGGTIYEAEMNHIELAQDRTPEFTIDWPHGHVTRDGRKARIVCTDAKGLYPFVALIDDGKHEFSNRVNCNGVSYSCTDYDLINAPAQKREFWMNVYEDGASHTYPTKEDADDFAELNRIACVHVTEGDGL